MTEQQQPPPPWAPPGLPPITDPYVTVGGDSLPSLAERAGRPGEWQAIAQANEGHPWADYNNLQPGLTLVMPDGWVSGGETQPAGEDLSGLSASELVSLAQAAQTLAELDAIDAVAGGRVTVTNAVDARRTTLLDQGATA